MVVAGGDDGELLIHTPTTRVTTIRTIIYKLSLCEFSNSSTPSV